MVTNADTETIVVDYDLPGSPQQVWRVLTEPALLGKWLMENDIRAEVGHRFTFRAEPVPPHWDGVVHCEVLEVKPLSRLSYTWRGGALDTVVTWTLTARPGGGTSLRLEHAGFSKGHPWGAAGAAKGWRGHLADRLQRLIATLVGEAA